ncbi:helix-turn-helix transcriptional regulator [Nocardia sp. NBC_01377]|uniref:helix-turn-helix domain-containing protein n=1 Tax=Nocardia sp. NBC_01377 TaxID=2903595 RepID=UPI00324C1812
MDHRGGAREFLASRRARLTLEQVGLADDGGIRRVPGLRREEVALLAGVSVDYYTRVERGNLQRVSDCVLNALARALRLAPEERTYLFRVGEGDGSRFGSDIASIATPTLRPSVRAVVDGLSDLAVTVSDSRMRVITANVLGRALYAPLFDQASEHVNHARFMFLDPRARLTYEILRIGGDSELAMLVFSAEAGSPSHDALALLTTWSIPVVDDESARYR